MYQIREWVLIFQDLINILIGIMVLLHFIRKSTKLNILAVTTEMNVPMVALASGAPLP